MNVRSFTVSVARAIDAPKLEGRFVHAAIVPGKRFAGTTTSDCRWKLSVISAGTEPCVVAYAQNSERTGEADPSSMSNVLDKMTSKVYY